MVFELYQYFNAKNKNKNAEGTMGHHIGNWG